MQLFVVFLCLLVATAPCSSLSDDSLLSEVGRYEIPMHKMDLRALHKRTQGTMQNDVRVSMRVP